MLKIPDPQKKSKESLQKEPKEKSNLDIYEAIGKEANKPVASPQPSNPLDELDQFGSAPEPTSQPSSPSQSAGEIPVPEPSVPEPSYGTQQDFGGFQPQQMPIQSQVSTDSIQQIVEAVVEEKWDDLMNKVGDIRLWKEKTNNDFVSVKQEILRTQNRFENLQKAVLGKVHEYNESIININTEMKALEKVFEKILQPLTDNIKELSKITNKLKKK